jgi:hypothetical protein
VSAGVSDFTFLCKRLIATSTTLFSFSLLRPISSDATAKAKLASAASWVAPSSIPQKFMLSPVALWASFRSYPTLCCQWAVADAAETQKFMLTL